MVTDNFVVNLCISLIKGICSLLTDIVFFIHRILDINFRFVSFIIHVIHTCLEYLTSLSITIWNVSECLVKDFLTFSEDVSVTIGNIFTFANYQITLLGLNLLDILNYVICGFAWMKQSTVMITYKILRTLSYGLTVLTNIIALTISSVLLFFQLIPDTVAFIFYCILNVFIFITKVIIEITSTTVSSLVLSLLGMCFFLHELVINFPYRALIGFFIFILLCKTIRRNYPHCLQAITTTLSNMRLNRRQRRIPVRRIRAESSSEEPKETGENVNRLMTEMAKEREIFQCIICHENQRSIILIPCRHICMCAQCTDLLLEQNQRCPVCRAEISYPMQVYF